MTESSTACEQLRLDNSRKIKSIYPNDQKSSLKRLKSQKNNRLTQLFFPTRSRVKLHQSQSSTSKQTSLPLTEQVARLNQRAVDVQTGLQRNISSLQTQRLPHLTTLNQKTRDLETTSAEFEHSSSKRLKQEQSRRRKLSYMFKIALLICLTAFSFVVGYMIVQLMRDRGLV
ncbi:unnamed protein product [Adineta ricciae]|uniref:Uncharacterized protein n=1 Tax=Adineta ricciae TaxID=249248 RepID=A0A814BKU4_ADIRI|nr:unnamed protein product [Adineta ricciae]CAF0929239.1 unnamed protein product [Adineta ricciae]